MRRDLGDFQTPPALVAEVLGVLGPIGTRWPRVLEPTCGRGHFLAGLLAGSSPPREVLGIEVQETHCQAARELAGRAEGARVEITQASLFDLDLRRDLRWEGSGPLLVVGNPPWITNAALGTLGSDNLPRKHNLKGLRGLAAKTGAANFDAAEAVWLKLLTELAEQPEPVTIVLLCKQSVARAVLEFARLRALPVASASLHELDARRWFGAAVAACLLRIDLGPGRWGDRVPVFASLTAREPRAEMGFAAGRLVADWSAYQGAAAADGACPLTWRQGLKHDASSVLELVVEPESGALRNRQGEVVAVESGWVYPLHKATDLHRPDPRRPRRAVLVTQRRLGEDTARLERDAPRLWAYLRANAPALARRKSSIYRNQPPFALFGIGPYTFAPYKVAVSGLHAEPRFRVLGPEAGRPVLVDDTCYFVACDALDHAEDVAARCNSPTARALIRALTFPGSKRPITKSILQRLALDTIAVRSPA